MGGLARLLRELAAALTAASASSADRATAVVLAEFVRLVGTVDAEATWPEPESARQRLPVCRFCDDALAAASRTAAGSLATALGAQAPALSWTQNPNYRRRPPDPTFLDNYGYAVIAGPADGPPALALTPGLAVGVLLLGPGAHYPLHAHPAVEIYYTLTPDGEWWREDGPWRRQPPGTAIYHAPNQRHATRAGATPLLAIYLWRGDLATHARLTA